MAESPDPHFSDRQRLLERLLEAVKQCQVRFGGRTELATDSDSRVSCVCTQLEVVLQHGMKRGRSLLQLGQLPGRKKVDSEPVMWHFVKEHLSKDEVDYIMRLKSISSDAGRGRAWLRIALNERTLETKIHHFLSDQRLLGQFYEPHAFLFDVERSSMLPMMAAGLGSILFALQPDQSSLDSTVKTTTVTTSKGKPADGGKKWETSTAAVVPQGVQDAELVGQQRKKKKKKSIPNRPLISSVSYDEQMLSENSVCPPSAAAAAAAASRFHEGDNKSEPTTTGEAGNGEDSHEASGSRSPQRVSSALLDNVLAGHAEVVQRVRAYLDSAELPSDMPTTSAVVPPSVTSGPSSNLPGMMSSPPGVMSPPDSAFQRVASPPGSALSSWNTLLTQVPSSAPGPRPESELPADAVASMAAYDSSDSSSTSSGLRPSEYGLEDTVAAMKAVRTLSIQQESISASSAASQQSSDAARSHSGLSLEEMRSALLTMARRKDELEQQNSILEAQRDSELARAADLQHQLEEAGNRAATESEQSRSHVQALTRENELLKHQLKKYVGVVQTLKRDAVSSMPSEVVEAIATLRHDAGALDPIPPPRQRSREFEKSEEDSQFEQKLVQVAEMHGELLEFNQFMHQQIVNKDKVIAFMRAQLATARGVRVDDVRVPGSPVQSPAVEQPTASLVRNCLLNVWIPSVFMYGKGSDGYHVYQVFIRVRDEEWNVYRRYAQFYEFRKHVIHSVPSAGRHEFPPKKALGNKDSTFVEQRRQGLESFLRFLLQLLLSGAAKGTAYHFNVEQLTKATLSQHLPFFREQRSGQAGPPRQLISARPRTATPQYNGL